MALTDNNGQDGFNTYSKETGLGTAGNTNILTSGTGSVFALTITTSAQAGFFKMFDSASITHGTTQPVFCIPIPASSAKQTIFCSSGIVFSTACSVNAAQSNGGKGGDGDAAISTVTYIIYGGA